MTAVWIGLDAALAGLILWAAHSVRRQLHDMDELLYEILIAASDDNE